MHNSVTSDGVVADLKQNQQGCVLLDKNKLETKVWSSL